MFDDTDSSLEEADARLEQALYYRQLIKFNFFGAEPSQAAKEVEKEVQEFARFRLEVLLGLRKQEDDKGLFSNTETKALKALANKVLGSVEKPQQVSAPALLIQKPQQIQRPITIEIDESGYPEDQEHSEITTLESEQPVDRQPKVVKAKKQKKSKDPVPNGSGKRYIKHVKANGEEIQLDVTRQATDSGRIPMPSNAQIEQLMAMQAASAVDTMQRTLSVGNFSESPFQLK